MGPGPGAVLHSGRADNPLKCGDDRGVVDHAALFESLLAFFHQRTEPPLVRDVRRERLIDQPRVRLARCGIGCGQPSNSTRLRNHGGRFLDTVHQ